MRILILADSDSPHTIKWVKSISLQNIMLNIFSFHKPDSGLYIGFPNVQVHSLNISRSVQFKGESSISKIFYLKAVKMISEIIKEFRPDILHSHYASSYGLIGAITNFHPYIISVWGSDIFSFPKHSVLHRWLIKYVFLKSDLILSTSQNMKLEIQRYTKKNVEVTPFGIDIERFKPILENKKSPNDELVIGTIKSLEKNYGIEFLIKSFKIIKEKFPQKKMKLLLVGQGTEENKLRCLVKELGITESTTFTGYVPFNEVHKFHNILDIYVAVSLEESFGVAVLEASACMKPVIVSNAGGLPEVVEDGITGFIVKKENVESLVDALEKLVSDPKLRESLGKNGREMVVLKFNWSDCILQMLKIYENILLN